MKPRRWVAVVAVVGTAVIGVGAFWLSFSALSDLASRAGIPGEQGWIWAAIVDGVIVTSTVAAVALDGAGRRATWFAWLLLGLSAGVSVIANVIHAVVTRDDAIPALLVGAIAAVPPLVLLAMTHLTVVVVRYSSSRTPEASPGADLVLPEFLAVPTPARADAAGLAAPPAPRQLADRPRRLRPPASERRDDRAREVAARLKATGMSNAQIAAELGVHRSTIGRWFLDSTSETSSSEEDVDE